MTFEDILEKYSIEIDCSKAPCNEPTVTVLVGELQSLYDNEIAKREAEIARLRVALKQVFDAIQYGDSVSTQINILVEALKGR